MSRTTTPNGVRFGIRGKDEKRGAGLRLRSLFLLRLYVVCVQKTGHKIWRRSGHLWVSQVNKRWRGRLPPSVRRYAVAACAPADAPPRPRNWILRRPRRQRRGAPARRPCGGWAACVSRRRPDLVGGWCRRRSSVMGCPLRLMGGRGALCRWWGRGAAVAAARGRAVPLRCTLGPGRRPRPRCAPCAPAGAG